MEPTLRMCKGQVLAIPAFDQAGGFPGCYIYVNFGGPRHPMVWASNVVVDNGANSMDAVIHVDPEVATLPLSRRKALLAYQWLDAMVVFRDGARPGKQVLDKVHMIVFLNTLARRTPWQDTPDFEIRMHAALRRLLVTEDSIMAMLANDFRLDTAAVRSLCAESPNEAARLLDDVAESFAAKWSVDIDLVYDRLQEILLW